MIEKNYYFFMCCCLCSFVFWYYLHVVICFFTHINIPYHVLSKVYILIYKPLTLVQMFMSCFPHVMSQQVEDLSKRNLPKQKNERFCIRERLLMQALLWPLSSAFFSCYVFLMWGVNKWKIYLGKFFPSDKKEKDVEKDC